MHPDRVFYWMFGRFWELATGTALFQFHQTGRLLPTSSQGENAGDNGLERSNYPERRSG